MNCNYKVNIKDIQNKYKFNIFAMGGYNDSDLRKMIESVYYALPRVNGSGTNVTLTDTAFSYMKNKLYATDISQEGEPTTDAPQTIHTISGDNDIVIKGKNLFDINKYSNAILRASGNNVALTKEDNTTLKSLNKVSSTRNYCGIPIPNSEDLLGKTITVNANVTINGNTDTAFQFWFMNTTNLTTEIGTAKKITTNGNQTYTATIPSTMPSNSTGIAIVIYGSFDLQAPVNSYVTFNELQVEYGSTATTYEPYQSNSVLLTLGDKEICKIGNYEDKIFKAIKGNEIYDSLSNEEKNTLDYGKWYLRKKVGKYTFTGNENMSLQNNGKRIFIRSTGTGNNIPEPLHTPNVNIKYGMYSNKLVEVTAGQTWGGTQGISYDYDSNVNLGNFDISINGISTLEAYRTAIVGIILYYILQTPTNELFNDAQQEQLEDIYNNMLSYEGQTNISQINNDLPFNINSSALKDLSNL